jgi:hypothetical protein
MVELVRQSSFDEGKITITDRETEAIPDITPLLKPTTLGDFATYFFASAGGLFLGGELGMPGANAHIQKMQ